jgi:hypothetical protein
MFHVKHRCPSGSLAGSAKMFHVEHYRPNAGRPSLCSTWNNLSQPILLLSLVPGGLRSGVVRSSRRLDIPTPVEQLFHVERVRCDGRGGWGEFHVSLGTSSCNTPHEILPVDRPKARRLTTPTVPADMTLSLGR